jgi:hypothetical protein
MIHFSLDDTEGAMELCSLDEAFPNIDTGSVHKSLTGSSGFPYVGGTDSKPSREERRSARKKAKKMKGPTLAYSDSVSPDLPALGDETPDAPIDWRGRAPTDPDRPAVKRMEPVKTIQDENEGLQMPTLPKASCLFSDPGTPSYFGKDLEDSEESFSSFSSVGSDNPNYMLQPDVTKTFDLKGVAKAGGVLPGPNLDDTWKPMSPAASYTSYTKNGKDEEPGWSMSAEQKPMPLKGNIPAESPSPVSSGRRDTDDKDVLMGRINSLVARLDSLEKKKSQDTQTEILMFVGTGVFIMLSLEFLTRH